MSSALEQFRAQREATEDIRVRLLEVSTVLRSIQEQTRAIATDEAWHKLLSQEETWLVRAKDFVLQVQRLREHETERFWPAMWRRWIVAVAFALAVSFAAGSGYVWASRPYADEVAELRSRLELLDHVAQRVMKMRPAERREFDALMGWNERPLR